MIDIKDKHLKILLNILNEYNYEFYIFGSRINGKAKEFSDVDLFYKDHIPEKVIQQLEEAFEESDLPYTVDLIDFNRCDSTFQEIMLKNYVSLKTESKEIIS